MSVTAISLVIADDMTTEQIKTILTSSMNILISVLEVSSDQDAAVSTHLKVEAEVQDLEMLSHILSMLQHGISQGELITTATLTKGETDAVIAAALAKVPTKTKNGERA